MNAWLATLVGDTAAPIVGFILLFLLVIALLLIVFAVLRRVTGGTFVAGGRNRQVRLSVTDAAAVDNRRRLVLVRRDDVEHLILIGGPSDVVIEQNIRQFAKQPSRVEPAAPVTTVEQEPRPANGVAEAPRAQQTAPAAAERVTPPVAPAPRATPATQTPAERPAPAAPAPQIPLRSTQPHPVAPPRDLRLAEPPKHAQAPAPVPEAITQATAAAIPAGPSVVAPSSATVVSAVEAAAAAVPVQDNGNGWQRTASPSFGTPRRNEPPAYIPPPARETPVEVRTTTAAAFPFAVRNEGSPTSKEPTLDILGLPDTAEPEVSLGDMDFQDAFESNPEGELHIAPGNGDKPKKADSIEDEMERLLGDLSNPDKR
ncbi:hypothetical protein CU102_05425 [Phyllobacterium brassicacearum]|uniref:Flagellar biosynthesis protein FliO n=1 Tax=Phyllobacterium brassicacearum TaxID=314235 RepID=A0A2P7BTE5_9HYPH|nr:flagellar biosynthetic protein FliO [Phyllobacterium brassicacearum]PSH69717.1 hypothetical protein CU102_05425 [Phyllobacterium brassicacearum]TDQ34858.1 flagellar biosynthesis protein FliO [Phyllobacterium brassicacearum]